MSATRRPIALAGNGRLPDAQAPGRCDRQIAVA